MKKKPLRSENIREANEKLVLSLIHKTSGISQSEVVLQTGLKPPTVFRIFSMLEEAGFIQVSHDQPFDSDKKGRRPVYYSINPKSMYVIGIDFWSRSAAIVLEDFGGNAIYQHTRPLVAKPNAEDTLDVIGELIESSLAATRVNRDRILGIGIGAPGQVDIDEGRVIFYSRIEGMKDFALGARIEQKFDIPVTVHNNAAVIALSGFRYGIAHDSSSLLTILIRSGVGGSFIHEKKLMVTNGATILELGRISVELSGENCECSGKGCLEAYLSEDAFLDAIQPLYPLKDISELDSLMVDEIPAPCLEVNRSKGKILSQTMRSLYHLFGPKSFLIVTRSQILSKLLSKFVDEIITKDQLICPGPRFTILSTKYDPTLACRGAADLVLDQFFS